MWEDQVRVWIIDPADYKMEKLLKTFPIPRIELLTWSNPRCPLRSNYLLCFKNRLFIVGIGPIIDKEL